MQGSPTYQQSFGVATVAPRALTCKFHPPHLLHTFCVHPNCMLPMCSSCISIHNEDHVENGSYGQYKDISVLVGYCAHELKDKMSLLEEISHEYVDDYIAKGEVESKWVAVLEKARFKMHEEVDRSFDRCRLTIEEKMAVFREELQTDYEHLEEKVHNFYSIISRQYSDIMRFYSSEAEARSPRTQRSSLTVLTASNTFQSGSKGHDSDKDERRILKTLIEYFSKNSFEEHQASLSDLRKVVHDLKSVAFAVKINAEEMGTSLRDVCERIIDIQITGLEQDQKSKHGLDESLPARIISKPSINSKSKPNLKSSQSIIQNTTNLLIPFTHTEVGSRGNENDTDPQTLPNLRHEMKASISSSSSQGKLEVVEEKSQRENENYGTFQKRRDMTIYLHETKKNIDPESPKTKTLIYDQQDSLRESLKKNEQRVSKIQTHVPPHHNMQSLSQPQFRFQAYSSPQTSHQQNYSQPHLQQQPSFSHQIHSIQPLQSQGRPSHPSQVQIQPRVQVQLKPQSQPPSQPASHAPSQTASQQTGSQSTRRLSSINYMQAQPAQVQSHQHYSQDGQSNRGYGNNIKYMTPSHNSYNQSHQ